MSYSVHLVYLSFPLKLSSETVLSAANKYLEVTFTCLKAIPGTVSLFFATLAISYLLWAETPCKKGMTRTQPERRRSRGEAGMNTMYGETGRRKGRGRQWSPSWKWKEWGGLMYFREQGETTEKKRPFKREKENDKGISLRWAMLIKQAT